MPGRTQMHKHLENVEYYLSNFNDNKFNHWIRGKGVNEPTITPQQISEMNQTVKTLKSRNLNKTNVQQFGAGYSNATNTRHSDILLTDGTHIELKNQTYTSGYTFSDREIDQVIGQNGAFGNINNLNKFEWIAEASRGNDETVLKELWKNVFKTKKTDIFNTIWDNQGLRNSLFPDLPTNITPQVKQQYFGNQFESLVNSTNSNLYNIIKTQ
jgi:hypothetical protein